MRHYARNRSRAERKQEPGDPCWYSYPVYPNERSIRNYKVELRSGVELSVSRQYYTAIRSAWLEWKGQFGDE